MHARVASALSAAADQQTRANICCRRATTQGSMRPACTWTLRCWRGQRMQARWEGLACIVCHGGLCAAGGGSACGAGGGSWPACTRRRIVK